MKVVVFITGTNAVGKSSLAYSLIEHFGGISEERACMTYLKDKRYGLAGRYKDKRYGGVDRITNEKGSSCTSRLADIVREGLKTCDVVFCEGSFMNTFGLNLTNALFLGDKAVVVSLYAPPEVIYRRITARSNGRSGKGYRNWPTIFRKQVQALIAAQKYESVGVKVLQYDTSQVTTGRIMEELLDTIGRMQDVGRD